MAMNRNHHSKHVEPSVRINGTFVVPQFSQCLVNLFQPGGSINTEVMCSLLDDKLLITSVDNQRMLTDPSSRTTRQTFGPVTLQHSPLCPLQEIGENSDQLQTLPNKPIRVAVAVLLESSDNHVLLTQRAHNLRSYPNVWVPPGGHLDRGETLLECGLREVEEETGLQLRDSDIKTRYLCLWEAVAPPLLSRGTPHSHSLAVYIHVQAPYTWMEMQPKLKVNEAEVQAWSWFSENTVHKLLNSQDGGADLYRPGKEAGNVEVESTTLSAIFKIGFSWAQGVILSGTQLALTHWSRKSSKL